MVTRDTSPGDKLLLVETIIVIQTFDSIVKMPQYQQNPEQFKDLTRQLGDSARDLLNQGIEDQRLNEISRFGFQGIHAIEADVPVVPREPRAFSTFGRSKYRAATTEPQAAVRTLPSIIETPTPIEPQLTAQDSVALLSNFRSEVQQVLNQPATSSKAQALMAAELNNIAINYLNAARDFERAGVITDELSLLQREANAAMEAFQ